MIVNTKKQNLETGSITLNTEHCLNFCKSEYFTTKLMKFSSNIMGRYRLNFVSSELGYSPPYIHCRGVLNNSYIASSPLTCCTREQQMRAQGLEPLPSLWDTWMELRAHTSAWPKLGCHDH